MLTRILRIDVVEASSLTGDGNPNTSVKLYKYTWKSAARLRALFLMPRNTAVTGIVSDAGFASCSVKIEDNRQWFFCGTGRGVAFVSALAVHGKGRRWFPIDKTVQSGDVWQITVANDGTIAALKPILLLAVDDPAPVARSGAAA